MEEVIKSNIETEIVNKQGPPKKEYSGYCAPWQWYSEQPLKRWRFLVFFICGCLTLIWFLMYIAAPYAPNSYIFSGLIVIIMSAWACNHFRILAKLTDQVEKLRRLNTDFLNENKKLRKDVILLSRTEKHLSGIEGKIGSTNDKLKANIVKFQELDNNLRTISDSNIKGIEKIQKKSKLVRDSMQQSLIRNEKAVLHAVYDSLEWNNNMRGLDRTQFDEFWQKLPKSYYQRWLKFGKTFDEISGDDEILDYKEFTSMIDQFAKQEALCGGSK